MAIKIIKMNPYHELVLKAREIPDFSFIKVFRENMIMYRVDWLGNSRPELFSARSTPRRQWLLCRRFPYSRKSRCQGKMPRDCQWRTYAVYVGGQVLFYRLCPLRRGWRCWRFGHCFWSQTLQGIRTSCQTRHERRCSPMHQRRRLGTLGQSWRFVSCHAKPSLFWAWLFRLSLHFSKRKTIPLWPLHDARIGGPQLSFTHLGLVNFRRKSTIHPLVGAKLLPYILGMFRVIWSTLQWIYGFAFRKAIIAPLSSFYFIKA